MSASATRREKLSRFVKVPEVWNHVQLDTYFRLAKQLRVEIQNYVNDTDLDRAYILCKRFSALALHCIPRHNAFNATKYRQDKLWLKREAKTTLALLEEVVAKMDAEARPQAAAAAMATPDTIAAALPTAGSGDQAVSDLEARLRALRGDSIPKAASAEAASKAAAEASPAPSAPAFDDDDEALAEAPSLGQATPGPEPLHSFRVESRDGVDVLILDGQPLDAAAAKDLSEQEIRAAYETLRLAKDDADDKANTAPREDISAAPAYRYYPGSALDSYAESVAVQVPRPQPVPRVAPVPKPPRPMPSAPNATAPSYNSVIGSRGQNGVAKPAHDPNAILNTPGAFGSINHAVLPAPEPVASLGGAEEVGDGGLRQLILPAGLPAAFERIAKANTNRGEYGIETCGILCGRVKQGKLVCTHLVVPKQSGTSDTVEMANEEDLFDFCLSRDLLMLGWIHTHPRQSCFLSSVDVHTHAGYQLMLAEAVALVVAPYDSRRHVGIFHLSPEGMRVVSRCQRRGFHHHDMPHGTSIYQDANVRWSSKQPFDVEDLRRR